MAAAAPPIWQAPSARVQPVRAECLAVAFVRLERHAGDTGGLELPHLVAHAAVHHARWVAPD
jgi:hypothetical protein